MVLKAYTGFSDRQLVEHLNGNIHYQIFCGDAPTIIEFMISTDEIVLPMVKSGNPMSEMILK